jgi:eukaryotic-like serine/threonine-protein kinase
VSVRQCILGFPVTLASGVRLGPYEIVAPIGAGGMGEVYRARDTRLDRTVAIKILPAEFAQDARLRTRFEREAKAISSLNHPHICALFDVGPDYLVMEHCEGKTLARRIAEGPLPIEQVLQYGVQIADALDKAHRQGIIHRDLKPANVMLTKSGVKLLDFGLAKQQVASSAAESTVQQVTEEGKILGTIQYMAPELFHGKEADARSDIFALGLVLYEMVAGKAAFSGVSKASLIAAILEHEPEPMKPTTPAALDRLIRACLAKDPDERIQTAHDVKLQLGWVLDAAAPVSRRTVRIGWSGIAALLLTAVVAAVVTWLVARPRPTPQPLRRFSISLPSTAPVESAIAISRDGRRLVYCSSDTAPLYLRSMDTGEVRPLLGTEGARVPFFSPDGEWIGFDVEGGLKKIAVAGGAPVLVCKTPMVRGATWLPDDTIVFALQGDLPWRRVASAGGTAQELTTRNEFSYWPSALPDGQHVLYTIGDGSGNFDQAKIAVLSLRDMRSDVVMEGGTCPRYARGHLIYSRSGTLFAVPFDTNRLKVTGAPVPIASDAAGLPIMGLSFFDFADDGTLVYVPRNLPPPGELVWVGRKGGTTSVSNVRRAYADPRTSPDGRQIVIRVTDRESSDLWLFDVPRENWTRLTSGGKNGYPVWSRDGKQIFFTSNRNGAYNVYTILSDGSQPPRQLTHGKAWIFPVATLHEESSLLVIRQRSGDPSDYCLVNLEQPDIVKPVLTPQRGDGSADLSPDSRWMAFVSDETGRNEIYVSGFPALGRKWLVSTEGGITPRFRSDGRELFYRNGKKMMAVDLTLGRGPIIGKPRTLFEGEYGQNYDVTPDGQHFVIVRRGKTPPTLQINAITGLFDNLGH